MASLTCYKSLPEWNAGTLPEAFRRQHNTQAGTWAQLAVKQGTLDFAFLDEAGHVTSEHRFSPSSQPPLIEPQQWHRIVSCSDDVACQLSFLCEPADYFAKKHGLTRTHSEVVEAAPLVKATRALDLGCGNGRNTLYLAKQGAEIDAWDRNAASLENLRRIADEEGLDRVHVREVDLNGLAFGGQYDFILSTVVLMFLQPDSIPGLIAQMRAATVPGGHNLIVAPIDAPDHPCPVPFPFLLKPGELRAYYADWDILKYNENPGTLHRTDEQGRRIPLRFATLLAQRPG